MSQPTYVPPPPLSGLLRRGMPGPDSRVERAQEQLLEAGYFSGVPRGNFGPLTEAAVSAFQMQHVGPSGQYLEVDGIIGPDTWWALHNYVGNPQYNRYDAMIPDGVDGQRREFLGRALAERAANTMEIPTGSNWGDGVTRFLEDIGPAPWCMYMVSELYRDVTGRYPLDHRHGHCWTFWQAARRAGLAFEAKSSPPVPGDVGIMRYAPSYSGHAFIVLRVSEDGMSFNTIGGNEANRVKVGLRRRDQPTLLGWVNLWGSLPTDYERGVVSAAAAASSLGGTR